MALDTIFNVKLDFFQNIVEDIKSVSCLMLFFGKFSPDSECSRKNLTI